MNTSAALRAEMKDFIPTAVRQSGHSAKVIALFADATPRAAEKWEARESLPSAPNLILLAREIPALKAKVLEWLEADSGQGGDPAKVLNEIQRLLTERSK